MVGENEGKCCEPFRVTQTEIALPSRWSLTTTALCTISVDSRHRGKTTNPFDMDGRGETGLKRLHPLCMPRENNLHRLTDASFFFKKHQVSLGGWKTSIPKTTMFSANVVVLFETSPSPSFSPLSSLFPRASSILCISLSMGLTASCLTAIDGVILNQGFKRRRAPSVKRLNYVLS